MDQTAMDAMRAERKILNERQAYSYSPDDFPGSRGWLKCQAAVKALADFDAAHPEVKAEIDAADRAKLAAEKAYSLAHPDRSWA